VRRPPRFAAPRNAARQNPRHEDSPVGPRGASEHATVVEAQKSLIRGDIVQRHRAEPRGFCWPEGVVKTEALEDDLLRILEIRGGCLSGYTAQHRVDEPEHVPSPASGDVYRSVAHRATALTSWTFTLQILAAASVGIVPGTTAAAFWATARR
jgi:hypothetical protein